MASSNLKSELYDVVRKKWVKQTPEERIRQGWVQKMILELGFPLALLTVEKELATLPHLSHLPPSEIPKRRVDILVFAKNIHPAYSLYPLLMIECKALSLNSKNAAQVIGYNNVVQAPFVGIANDQRIMIGRYDPLEKHFSFQEGLPSYSDLLKAVQT
jgi:hypothetical protein